MSKAARSVYVFSVYLMVMGAALTAVPNLLLELLGLPKTGEVWIHVAGMLTFVLGFYYFQSAKTEYKPFFHWTVYGRLAGCLMFFGLWLSGIGPPILILFGGIDGVAALWTYFCLQQPEDCRSGSCRSNIKYRKNKYR